MCLTFGTKATTSGAEMALDPKNGLYSRHAYQIVGYDKKTGVVQYVNPWNSAFVFEMQLDELMKYIKGVTACSREVLFKKS